MMTVGTYVTEVCSTCVVSTDVATVVSVKLDETGRKQRKIEKKPLVIPL